MSSTNKKTESFFARYSWIVFFMLGLIITLFGFGDMLSGGATFESGEAPTVQGISGMTWQALGAASPNAASMIDYLVRAGGAHLFILGFLSMLVAVTAFRRGDRWAWYAMWLWPLWLGLIIVILLSAYNQPGPGIPPPLVSGSIFMVLAVLTLLLSYRKFFPKQQIVLPEQKAAAAATSRVSGD